MSCSSHQARNINDLLSDDCLRLIFNECPLRQLLHYRCVCTRWQAVIEQICQSKHSLKVFGSLEALQRYRFSVRNFKVGDNSYQDFETVRDFQSDVLVVRQGETELARRACQVLPQLFPDVNILILSCPQLLILPELAESMLSQWAPKITTLFMYRLPPPELQPHNLWPCIESMESLQILRLIRMYKSPIPEQTLSRLRHFSVTHYLEDLVPVLTNLGTACESIKLSMTILSEPQLQHVIRVNPGLMQTLKNFSMGTISSPASVNRLANFKALLRLICTKFSLLTFLDILMADQIDLEELIPILSSLKQLNELWIYIGRHQLGASTSVLYQLPQLASVTILYLEIYDLPIDQFCLWIGGLFPNLRFLTIKCEDYHQNYSLDFLNKRLRQEFRHLRKFYLESDMSFTK